ncbi:MAG: hypothetical protein KDB14_08285 [Planctomycetales bacterium]|nr:hypothetical protein [Planctomycetales bacterium]
MFSFEALKADHGDALLVHYGPEDAPRMLIVDGGPPGVFGHALLPRLEQIASFKGERPISARLAMVSHIDDDHITGINDLLSHLEQDSDPVVDIEGLWHNSFDDSIRTAELSMLADLGGVSNSVAASLSLDHFIHDIAAGVAAGKELRNLGERLGLVINAGAEFVAPTGRRFVSEGDRINLGHACTMRVLNPSRDRLLGLQRKWDGVANRLRDLSVAERRRVLARIVDDSLANISSIVVHLKRQGKTMLLTGDARGDHVMDGLSRAGLAPSGKTHVDILKVPHHGSDRNVSTDFFRKVTADHYVFSGDRRGTGSNPDRATIQMVTEVRGRDPYTMHFTTFDSTVEGWLEEDQRNNSRRYEYVFPDPAEHGIWIDLQEELWF